MGSVHIMPDAFQTPIDPGQAGRPAMPNATTLLGNLAMSVDLECIRQYENGARRHIIYYIYWSYVHGYHSQARLHAYIYIYARYWNCKSATNLYLNWVTLNSWCCGIICRYSACQHDNNKVYIYDTMTYL